MRDDRQRMVVELALKHADEMKAILDTGDGRAREEFRTLMTWIPEYAYEEVMKSYEQNGAPKGKVPPFFSEVTLYEMLGKDQARSLLGMMRSLGEALGFDRSRDLIEESESESGGADRSSPLTQGDVDALEGFMREDASYRLRGGGDAEKIIRITKTLPALRAMVGADPDICWKQLYAKDLQIGDRIFKDGAFLEVHGFLDRENLEKEFSEDTRVDKLIPYGEPLKDYEIPYKFRNNKAEPFDGKWLKWAGNIMISPNDEFGWRLTSAELLLIQRREAQ